MNSRDIGILSGSGQLQRGPLHEKRFCPDSSWLYTYGDIAFDKRFWDAWEVHLEALTCPAPSADAHDAAAVEECPPLPKRGRVGGQDAAAAAFTATSSGTAAAGDSCMNVIHADVFVSLAEKAKSLQREDQDARTRWSEHCRANHDGVKDPYKHTVASLRHFMDLHDL